jgi:hypothetical protein
MVTQLTPLRRLGDCPLSNVARMALSIGETAD